LVGDMDYDEDRSQVRTAYDPDQTERATLLVRAVDEILGTHRIGYGGGWKAAMRSA